MIKIKIPKKVYEEYEHEIEHILNDTNEQLGMIDESIEMFG